MRKSLTAWRPRRGLFCTLLILAVTDYVLILFTNGIGQLALATLNDPRPVWPREER